MSSGVSSDCHVRSLDAAERPGVFRFCVGGVSAPCSSIWKVYVRGDDIYIFSSSLGTDAKVSIHGSGFCHWVVSAEWFVRRGLEFRNRDRHIVKWMRNNPQPARAAHVFRLLFPESELRVRPALPHEKRVAWITPPPRGAALELEIYLAPPSADAPSTASSPYQLVRLMQARSQTWLVVLSHVEPMTSSKMRTLDDARAKAQRLAAQSVEIGHGAFPSCRADGSRELSVIGFVQSPDNPPGLVEFMV